MSNRTTRLSLVTAGIASLLCSFLCILAIWWSVSSPWQTWTHGPKLRPAVQKYLDLTTTIEGWQNPDVMAQVTTGRYLEYLIRTRCVDCSGVEVATGIQIQTFEVLWYDERWSKVRVQYEGAWQMVNPQTRAVIGQCNVGVYSLELLMIREYNYYVSSSSIWKVADVGEYISKVISKDEFARLQKTYCSK